MTDDNAADVDRACELMMKIGLAMPATQLGGKLRERPMSAYLERGDNRKVAM